jgi:hypothetical protein
MSSDPKPQANFLGPYGVYTGSLFFIANVASIMVGENFDVYLLMPIKSSNRAKNNRDVCIV